MPRARWTQTARYAAGVTALTLLVGGLSAPAAQAATDGPTVSGPVTAGTRGGPQTSAVGIVDLASAGYTEQEYFVSGTATSYAKAAGSTWTSDGVWPVTTGPSATYTTRILVRRPSDPAKFNGTVAVEWMNVTGQADGAPDFTEAQGELLRGGYAWVGVSAQSLGIDGQLGLRKWDAERYGSLRHPGDSYSYDIFSQAGKALRAPSGSDPLGDLRSKAARYLAFGESQSAGRMVTYVNAVQPVAGVYDGFFVHSRSGGAAALSQDPLPVVPVPTPARIRSDLTAPVFQVETETDVPGFAPARQPDTDRLRTWELTGTAHFDEYGLGFIRKSTAKDFPGLPSLLPECVLPVNDAPARYAYDAAVRHLDRWVRDRTAPPTGAQVVLKDGLPARDAYGIALGGVRLPDMDVPRFAHSGLGNTSKTPPNFCGLFGVTTPLPDATLSALYPGRPTYVRRFTAAVEQAQQAGVVLPEGAAAMLGQAPAFTPPASCAATPTVTTTPSAVTSSGSSRVVVSGRPGAEVELYGYSRPSTTYTLLRPAAELAEDGTTSFDVRPPSNTRLYAQVLGCTTDPVSMSRVLTVATQLSFTATRTGPRRLVFRGAALPVRAGGLVVSLYRVAADGSQVLTAQTRASATDGSFTVDRTFTGGGRFGFVVRTGTDLQNAAGSSGVRSLLVA
ncbi:MAG: hypothetical protein JWM64_1005 [Frankiales bacterium]|nr:hypothetical protein [Frankiales bacterium]